MKMAIGIDVHKEKSTAYAVYGGMNEPASRHRKVLDAINRDFKRFPSDAEGYGSLAKRIQDHDAHVLIENSTKSHEVYWMLKNLGIDVVVAHSTDLYQITKAVDKTDDNDARKLAGYMRRYMMGETEFSRSYIPEPKTLMQRELCRLSLGIRRELSAAKQRTRSHILIRGTELSRKYDDISSAGAIRELLASDSIILRFDAVWMKELKRFIHELERGIWAEMNDNRMFQIVWSIPGFGILSSGYMASMIGDISRFEDSRSFAASFGITPKLDISADKYKETCITRRGDASMRRLLYQATFVHVTRFDSELSDKYRRMRAAGHHHTESVVGCSNSMARMIHSMILNDREYVTDRKDLGRLRVLANSDNIEEEIDRFERNN